MFMTLRDTLKNFLTGIGTAKDPTMSAQFTWNPKTQQQLEAAYRSDWVSRKVIDIPAADATREWRSWQAEQDQIESLEEVERTLFLQRKMKQALILARLYGGSVMVLGVDGAGEPTEELNIERVKQGSLKWVHVLGRHSITCGPIEEDLFSPWFGEPTYYERNNGTDRTRIHPSRIVRFLGAEVPDGVLAREREGWGDSILQIVDDAVMAAGMVSGGIATMIHDAKFDIIKVPGFTENIATQEYADRLTARFTYANAHKSIINTLVMDKEEEWERVQSNFGGLPDVMKMYLLIASGAADIPATRFLGQSAAGLNATGDGDIRNYYDKVGAEQSTILQPALSRADEVVIRSALGARDPSIYYGWNSLWKLDDVQRAALAKQKADTFAVDVAAGLVPVEALAKARVNQLIEDGTYPGLDDAIAQMEEEAEAAGEEDPIKQIVEEKRLALAPPSNENDPDADEDKEPVARKKVADRMRRALTDTRPRTLYVHRDVINRDDIADWYKAQGFETVVEDLHVTIIYSKASVDWQKVGQNEWGQNDDGTLVVAPGGPRSMEQFGDGAIVLAFSSSRLTWRHEDIRRAGGSSDYSEYTPHITITYKGDGPDLKTVEPYRGVILFGPEIFEEIKPDRDRNIAEDGRSGLPFVDEFDPLQSRDPGGEGGGQWIPEGAVDEPEEHTALRKRSLSSKLTNNEEEVLGEYTEHNYMVMNDFLRTGEFVDAPDEEHNVEALRNIKIMDKVFARSRLADPIEGHRVVNSAIERQLRAAAEEGKVFTDQAFVSVATTRNSTFIQENIQSKDNTLIKVRMPKGMPAIPVADISSIPEEMEVILDRGMRYKLSIEGKQLVMTAVGMSKRRSVP